MSLPTYWGSWGQPRRGLGEREEEELSLRVGTGKRKTVWQ